MTTAVLTANAKQQFFDNNGQLATGGLLFTYAAGTTTKQNTYTNQGAATPNTNPIVLDSRGEANVWLDPALNYKFVLAPSTDTDPPTNAFWTVDNIVPFGTGVGYVVNTTTTPAAISQGPYNFAQWLSFAVGDQTSVISGTGTKFTKNFHRACTIYSVGASLKTASSSGAVTFDINFGGSSILSTKLTIDTNEVSSFTASTAPVISTSTAAVNSILTIDVDGTGAGAVGPCVDMLVNWTS